MKITICDKCRRPLTSGTEAVEVRSRSFVGQGEGRIETFTTGDALDLCTRCHDIYNEVLQDWINPTIDNQRVKFSAVLEALKDLFNKYGSMYGSSRKITNALIDRFRKFL